MCFCKTDKVETLMELYHTKRDCASLSSITGRQPLKGTTEKAIALLQNVTQVNALFCTTVNRRQAGQTAAEMYLGRSPADNVAGRMQLVWLKPR